ncbi:MAG: mandelate racemase [Armatimonadetes bacterium CG_4_9_14_3_um_filter_66_14]|nr:MAG: mandelate racemase [Armatimonadetes bacterium CG_4_9_14_3_um_filter_66_14]
MTSTKIERVQVFPVRYPTVSRFKFFEGPEGTSPGRPAVLVKVTTDDGTVGWGESVPVPKWSYETLESATTALKGYLGPAVIGRDPFDLAGAHAAMEAVIAPSFTEGMPLAKAGIDTALHDLAGKLSNQSLAQRWGRGQGGPVTLSWTLNPKGLDETEGLVQQGWERGFRNFNVKVAPDPKHDLELCRQTRKLVPDGFLWADANGGCDLATAMHVLPKLADLGVAVLEQPLPCHRIGGYQQLKRIGALPILMDEGVVTAADLIEFIRLDMLDGLAMKPARTGGLLQARRQVEILEDAGLLFLGSGLTDPDVSLAASLALYGAYGLRFPAALNGPQFLGASVVKEPLVPRDGKLSAPAGPGLGLEVDESKIAAIAV